jgi:hypothetical protein
MCLKFVDVHISANKKPIALKNLVRRISVGSKIDATTCDAICFNITLLHVVSALQYDDFNTYLYVSQRRIVAIAL